MKIAQVAPLWERVLPPNYGGIELVVNRLTDELVSRGHGVTLFASGDSKIYCDEFGFPTGNDYSQQNRFYLPKL